MKLTNKKRVSVIVESVFRDKILQSLEEVGVSGYTIYSEISGKGQHGVRGDHGDIGILKNVEIVSIMSADVAEAALEKLNLMLDQGIVMIVHVVEAQVIRRDHFN